MEKYGDNQPDLEEMFDIEEFKKSMQVMDDLDKLGDYSLRQE